jgi:hypothetical protein
MKGHIRERSPGHRTIVIDVRDPATGKRKRAAGTPSRVREHESSEQKRSAESDR